MVQDGALVPYDPAALGWLKAAVSVVNPPDFAGFPEHDKSADHFDLAKHADVLGNPADYFIHWEAEDNKKIYDYNYEATKQAIANAMQGRPTAAEMVARVSNREVPLSRK